jgi:hypothetical protein
MQSVHPHGVAGRIHLRRPLTRLRDA